jgi:cobalt-zinc-cadmium efflux system outer membrane protein
MRIFFLFLCSLLVAFSAGAQVARTLLETEDLFRRNNLQLLAEQYNINAAEAQVIQARIWDQPYLTAEINAINPQQNRTFDAGRYGQKQVAVQQLFLLGGKRRKEVDFAKSNVELARIQYEQLLRTLRYQIHQSFYTLYFSQVKAEAIGARIRNIDTLVQAYQVQVDRGNLPLKDLVRLRGLSLSLKSEQRTVLDQSLEQQETLKVLTGDPQSLRPLLLRDTLDALLKASLPYSEEGLTQLTLDRNPEYRYATQIIESDRLRLRWQQSLAVPDLTLGGSYDQMGGAFQNQTNLTLGIPLALWNRNKGNIKQAQAVLEQSHVLKDQTARELSARVSTAYQTYRRQQVQYRQIKDSYQQFEEVLNGMLLNFQRRNISLIEFTDFIENYNSSMIFIYDTEAQLLLTGDTLEYLTNEKLL